jgi:probable rRNA maturation factor
MELFVDLQIATLCKNSLPELSVIEKWVQIAILSGSLETKEQAELTVRIVDSDESQQLNHQYRNKNTATNVLSFPIH